MTIVRSTIKKIKKIVGWHVREQQISCDSWWAFLVRPISASPHMATFTLGTKVEQRVLFSTSFDILSCAVIRVHARPKRE